MAFYKDNSVLTSSNHQAFDTIHHAGEQTLYSGIYKCVGCGHEVTSVQNHTLPPQNHHQHTPAQGNIRWKLIVATTH
jgi:hypothetical protein